MNKSNQNEKIKQIAKKHNVSYETAYRIFKAYLDKGIIWKA